MISTVKVLMLLIRTYSHFSQTLIYYLSFGKKDKMTLIGFKSDQQTLVIEFESVKVDEFE